MIKIWNKSSWKRLVGLEVPQSAALSGFMLVVCCKYRLIKERWSKFEIIRSKMSFVNLRVLYGALLSGMLFIICLGYRSVEDGWSKDEIIWSQWCSLTYGVGERIIEWIDANLILLLLFDWRWSKCWNHLVTIGVCWLRSDW